MKTLKNYLINELGFNVRQPSEQETPEACSESNEQSLKVEEEFTLQMGEHREPYIRKKIREFYTQLGYSVTDAEFLNEAFCDIFVELREMGTIFVKTVVHHNQKTAWITVKKSIL